MIRRGYICIWTATNCCCFSAQNGKPEINPPFILMSFLPCLSSPPRHPVLPSKPNRFLGAEQIFRQYHVHAGMRSHRRHAPVFRQSWSRSKLSRKRKLPTLHMAQPPLPAPTQQNLCLPLLLMFLSKNPSLNV